MRIVARLLAVLGLILWTASGHALQGTSTSITANPALVTQTVSTTIHAVVSSADGTGTAPSGSVRFYANGLYLSSCSLSQGSCGIGVYYNQFTPGTSFVTATYSGDGSYAGSSSSQLPFLYDNSTPPPTPVISPPGGTYTAPFMVSISAASGTNIYYNLNGSINDADYMLYTGPFLLTGSRQVSAFARYTADLLVRSNPTLNSYGINPPSTVSGFSQTQLNGSATATSSTLTLTRAGSPNQAGSAFSLAPQSIQSFTNDFYFYLTNYPVRNPDADGFMFVVQNVAPTALGGSGVNLGFGGLPKSAGIKFDLYDNDGEGNNSTGLYTNGARPTTPSTDLTPSGVNLHSGTATFRVHMTYDGTTLAVTTSQLGNALNTATQSYTVDLPTLLGSSSAYVGFTGSTGGLAALQQISHWAFIPGAPTATPVFSPAPGSTVQYVMLSDATQYTGIGYSLDGSDPTDYPIPYTGPIPIQGTTTIRALASLNGKYSALATGTFTSPQPFSINLPNGFSSGSTVLNGSATLNGTRLELTKAGITNQASSAFFPTPVNVKQFITDFDFQLTNADADGFMFVLQNQGPNALGAYGIDLGYGSGSAGIAKSYGIKFDLYNNVGEGSSSSGFYTNGARPTTPATNLATYGLDLHSGHVFHVHITNVPAGGTTTDTILNVFITDTVTKAFVDLGFEVNLPTLLGGTTAFAGFTAGTGGLAATQDILNWTFMAP